MRQKLEYQARVQKLEYQAQNTSAGANHHNHRNLGLAVGKRDPVLEAWMTQQEGSQAGNTIGSQAGNTIGSQAASSDQRSALKSSQKRQTDSSTGSRQAVVVTAELRAGTATGETI